MTTPTHVKEAAEDICINLLFAPSPASHKQAVIDTMAILLKHLPQPSKWVDVRDKNKLPKKNETAVFIRWSPVQKKWLGQLMEMPVDVHETTGWVHFMILPIEPQPPAQKEKV